MQQLTERQCWKVIRDLVSEKNVEYNKLINLYLPDERKLLLGQTRDIFLSKYGFSSVHDFNDYASRMNGKPPIDRWLENLSSEDLLIFLDFRCNTLQQMYEQCRKRKTLNRSEIQAIAAQTPISKLAKYNGKKLNCTGKPPRVKGELKLSSMSVSVYDLREQALSQVLGKMAGNYAFLNNASLDEAEGLASTISTHNINLMTRITGYKLKTRVQAVMPEEIEEKVDAVKEEFVPVVDENQVHIVGFDEHKAPVFMRGKDYVDIFGHVIEPVEVIYDLNKNIIKPEQSLIRRYIGLDIQGTPIYETEDGYYNSIGERVDDDIFLDNTQDDMFSR